MSADPHIEALASAFRRHAGVADATEEAGDDQLATRLAALLNEARSAWPGVQVPENDFIVELARRSIRKDGALLDTLDRLHASDLYLACGATAKNAVALRHLERALEDAVAATLKRAPAAFPVKEELTQRLRERLLVSRRDGSPRLLEYAASGPLSHWLGAAAYRLAIDLLRAQQHDDKVHASIDEARLLGTQNLELDYLKAHYRAQFRDAFKSALEDLSPRARTVLRLNALEGLNIERIGQLFQVHRATVARWIATAREQLLRDTRRHLAGRLEVSTDELDSIMRLVAASLEVSLGSLMADVGSDAPDEG